MVCPVCSEYLTLPLHEHMKRHQGLNDAEKGPGYRPTVMIV